MVWSLQADKKNLQIFWIGPNPLQQWTDETGSLFSVPPSEENRSNMVFLCANLVPLWCDPSLCRYHLVKLLEKFGNVKQFDFLFHKSGPLEGQPRGYCFVNFNTREVRARESFQCVSGISNIFFFCTGHFLLLCLYFLQTTKTHKKPSTLVSTSIKGTINKMKHTNM